MLCRNALFWSGHVDFGVQVITSVFKGFTAVFRSVWLNCLLSVCDIFCILYADCRVYWLYREKTWVRRNYFQILKRASMLCRNALFWSGPVDFTLQVTACWVWHDSLAFVAHADVINMVRCAGGGQHECVYAEDGCDQPGSLCRWQHAEYGVRVWLLWRMLMWPTWFIVQVTTCWLPWV